MEQHHVNPGDTPSTVGGVLRRSRLAEGLGLRELARESGLSAGQLSRIEAGKTEQPSVETLVRLSQALDRDADALVVLATRPEALRGSRLQEARLRLLATIEPLAEPERQALAREEAELRQQISSVERLEREIAQSEAGLVEARAVAAVEPAGGDGGRASVLEQRLAELQRERAELDATFVVSVRAVAARLFTEIRGRGGGSLTSTAAWQTQAPASTPTTMPSSWYVQRRPLSELLLPSAASSPRTQADAMSAPAPRQDRQLRQLQQAWQRLTPARQRRVLEFVDDQLRLSIQDEISSTPPEDN
jgi:transcriptional regulator with XRE-family HTH domain